MKSENLRAYGFKVSEVIDEYDNEKWTKFHTYQVSDKGRVKNKYGLILRGCSVRGKKYSSVLLTINEKEQRLYFHQIVWMAFNGDIPDGLEILHDDSAPLLNGVYRNWLIDLSLGTRSENMIKYHAQKRNSA